MRFPIKYIVLIISIIVVSIIIYLSIPSNTPEGANIKIVVTVISTVLSTLVGLGIHRYKVNEENVNAHFDTIKQLVIDPISYIIKNDTSKLPDIDEIQSLKKVDDGALNFVLCKDFIENHYPEIKDIWLRLKRTLKYVEEGQSNIEHTIGEEIDKIIYSANSPYPARSVSRILNMPEIDRFKSHLLTDLLRNRYNPELFKINYSLFQLYYQELPEFELDEYGLATPIPGITLVNAEDRTVFLPIKIRAHFIERIKEIEEGTLKNYRNNFYKLDKERLEFQIELNKIEYKSKLNFYGNQCNYV